MQFSKRIIAKKMKALRKQKGFTQKQIAYILKCGSDKVYELERGRRNLLVEELFVLADAYGVTAYDFGRWK